MKIKSISTIVVERISSRNISFCPNNSELNSRFHTIVSDEGFLNDLTALTSRHISNNQSDNKIRQTNELNKLFSTIEFKFVTQLETSFDIVDKQTVHICEYETLYFLNKKNCDLFINMNLIDSIMTTEIAVSIGMYDY